MESKRIKGCIKGQAVGDALGLGAEFMTKEDVLKNYPGGLNRFEQIIQDRHRLRWKVGDWTDDTDMMLCIANAFISDNGEIKAETIAKNFWDWAHGTPMGIGNTIKMALNDPCYLDYPDCVSRAVWEYNNCHSAANGAIMRTGIVGLLPGDVEKNATMICRLTHWNPRCVGSCVIASSIINEMFYYDNELSYVDIVQLSRRLDPRIEEYVNLAYNGTLDDLKLGDGLIGYTLKALSAALWVYWHAESFKDGMLKIINEGGDADTNAAIACSILGTKFYDEEIDYTLLYEDELQSVVHGMETLLLKIQ